jgi:hypothetical protein
MFTIILALLLKYFVKDEEIYVFLIPFAFVEMMVTYVLIREMITK